MVSQVENFPDISFIGDMTLQESMDLAKSWYITHFKELTDEDIVLYDTDEEKILLDTVAYMFYQSAMYIDYAGKQNLLKYSVGDFLDNIGARCGVTREPAGYAKVTVRFTLTEAQGTDYKIPEGTQVAPSESDNVYFAVDGDTTIPAGDTYADARCTCLTAGSDGNGFVPGAIDELIDALPYMDMVSNVTISDGGTDEEDDDAYAERIFLAPSVYSTAGSEDAYIFHAKSASTLVRDVVVFSPEPCEVSVIITGVDGLPSAELISIVSDYLNESSRKVLTDQVTVMAPDTVTFNVDLTYYIDRSNSKYAERIQGQVEAAVTDYIKWQTEKIGRNITPSKLIQLVMEAGAKRVTVTSPSDTVVDADEIAVLGTSGITYGGIEDE